MLSSFWQVASVIVLATFGSVVAFSERFSDQSGQRCLASSARDLLGRESVAKDYFRAQRDLERNAFDSRVSDPNDRRIRELDSRRFDTRTDRLSRVYEDRIPSAERGLTRERMRSNEVDNEQSRARSQLDRAERRIDSYDQRRERQEERKNLSNLRRDYRSTLKTVSGRNDNRQYRRSLDRDSKIIDSTADMGRERFTLKENSQRIRDLVGSFNTRREMTRLVAGKRQVDDRRQNRGIAEKQERIQGRDVQNREETERRVLARGGSSERLLRQERSEDSFKRSETRSFNSNERFDINRNVLDASVPLNLNRNYNRRNERDSREVRDMNREESRVKDREIRRENVRIEDTKRDRQTFNERRLTRDTVELHGSTGRRNDRLNERNENRFQIRNVRLEREIERKVHDRAASNEIRNMRLERATERRMHDARTERSVQDARAERRLEREDERRVRDISVDRENERRIQEARVDRIDDRNAKLERRVRDSNAERRQIYRNERRVQEVRAERRDARNSRLQREDDRQIRDSTDERRESRSVRLERKTERKEQDARVERHDSRNARLDRESERRKQEARSERRVVLNTGFERENERKVRNSRDTSLERESTRLEREDERRVQETRIERRERIIPDDESRVERRESRNMRLEREDERKARDSSEDRRQDRRIERSERNARVDDIIRSSNRQFETRRKLQFSSYSPQVDSLNRTANLNVQMLQALLIGMLMLKVVTQQDMFTKKMNFMANSCKNMVSVGARKLF